MTGAVSFDNGANPGLTKDSGSTFSAFVDVMLLLMVLTVSSEMLLRLGPLPSLIWLSCYALALLRIFMVWPDFLTVLLRNKFVYLYPAVCLASAVWSKTPIVTIYLSLQLWMTFIIATYLGMRYSLVAILRALFFVLFLGGFLSVLHWATGIFPWPVYSRVGGMMGMFAQKNMLGQRMQFEVIVIFALLLMPLTQASARMKVLALAALPIIMLALGLSLSIASITLTPVVLGILAILCVDRIPRMFFFSVCAIVLLVVSLAPILTEVTGFDPIRIYLESSGKDATLTGRTQLWDIAQSVWLDHPILGVGFGAYSAAPEFANMRLLNAEAGAQTTYAFHNFILEILVASGIVGVIAMAILLLSAFYRLGRMALVMQSVAAKAGLTLVIAMIFIALLSPSLFRGHDFMMTLLVLLTVSAQEDWRIHVQRWTGG